MRQKKDPGRSQSQGQRKEVKGEEDDFSSIFTYYYADHKHRVPVICLICYHLSDHTEPKVEAPQNPIILPSFFSLGTSNGLSIS